MTDSIISKNAFWARFTADEIAAVQNFPDAYNKINTSENTVDLLSPDIFAGVVDLGLRNIPVSYTHLTLPTNREV